MNILAIAGSLRQASFNRQLAEAAKAIMASRHPEVFFDILKWDDIPFMNQDIEHPEPLSVGRVRAQARQADGIWIFSPEYNHAIPGPLKNLIDWLSRPISATEGHVLSRKPIALAGASIGMSGAAHAQDQLVGVLSFIDAHVMNAPRLTISSIGTQSKEGVLKLSSSEPYLEKQADAFVSFIQGEARPHVASSL